MKSGNKKPALYFARRALRLMKQIESMKAVYRDLDHTVEELVAIGAFDTVVGSSRVILHDNFLEKNTAFRSHAMRRYEVQIEPTHKEKK